jgi:hypothetical protein
MKNTVSSNLDLALYSIKIFANDGTIDNEELEELLAIALQDGTIDDDERETLANIFNKVPEWELKPEVAQKITEVRAKYQI